MMWFTLDRMLGTESLALYSIGDFVERDSSRFERRARYYLNAKSVLYSLMLFSVNGVFAAVLFLGAGSVPIALLAQDREPSFEKLTTSDGLSHNCVFTIVQDHKGFMWFGTSEGLNRYDGHSIVTYYADANDTTRLESNEINVLQPGPDNLLYIGTPIGLHTYDDKKGTFRRVHFAGRSIGQVNRIVKAADGTLYICSSRGLYTLAKGATHLTQLIANENVRNCLEYRPGVFWYSTFHKLIMINALGDVIREYSDFRDEFNRRISLTDNISCLYKDSSGNVWLGSNKNGLLKYDAIKDIFKHVIPRQKFNSLEVNIVRVIAEDGQKNLWIGTETGLFVYNDARGTFRHYTQSFRQPSPSLSDKAIYSICRSREGIMWVGTYFGGVNIDKPQEKGFKVLKADGGIEQLSGKAISEIIEDKKGRIWIATEDGGVNIWDRKSGKISYLKNEFGRNSLSVNNVHSLFEDDNGVFWIGTFLGGVNRYDSRSGSFKYYKMEKAEAYAFTNNMVYAIHKDRNGDLWIGTSAGLNKFDFSKDTYALFEPELFSGKFIYEIFEERSGKLWICPTQSDSLYYYDPATKAFTKYCYYDSSASPNQGFIYAHEDSSGNMWFGTMNRGLVKFDRNSKRFFNFTVTDGLPNNFVYGILEDSHGNLWLSTNKGLSRFNIAQERFTNYDISHGLPNNQFNYKSAFEDSNGWMYFGSINGLCYFHPDSLVLNEAAPATYLSDLKLFNESVTAGSGILANTIDATEAITLPHNKNVITLDFGTINYYASANNRYAYYLDGFEKQWNFVDKNSATYTNLAPGDYTFRVKASNNDGVWSDEKTLKITVLPPFWKSTAAMIFYSMLLVAVVLLYRALLNYRNREKMAIQLARMEKEKITEINQHKLNFFTYITHEFKTPLTLIIASIDKFLQDNPITDRHTEGYWSIKRSAKRLQFLIDQLMEFRRVEADHARVNYVNGDIIHYLQDTFQAFAPLFNSKRIDFNFHSNKASFNTYFDADKLEKIIANLLSNACKYTQPGGLVEMDVMIRISEADDHDSLKVIIYDSGVGLDRDELNNIFTAFYQTEHGKKSGSGTGIGLALVKSLTDFLMGSVEIESKHGSGTQVNLTLPLPKKIMMENIEVVEGNPLIDIEHVLPIPQANSQEERRDAEMQTFQIMIVEDTEELANFLGDYFEKKYKIVKAPNGAVALDKIRKSAPDVIVTDIMMPEMDGIELCRAVKADIQTSHIPVIFLTAKTTIENKLGGLNEGADGYIAKPFSLKELELVITNLLTSRIKLRNHFLKFGSVKDLNLAVVNRDQNFILKLTQIVEKHLDNPEFSITTFAQEACVSRSLLHMKLKKLVNLSASEFIRNIRLRRAADLLRGTDFSITDVAYKVGYSDSNYFSRSFKEKYLVNPSEYKQGVGATP